MNNKSTISELSRSLITIAWYFGPKGLDGQCCGDITMPEFIALDTILNTHNCSVHDIGIALGFTKSGATRIVNRLVSKGYVRKEASSEDGRVCCVAITKKGETIIKDADSRYSEKFEQLISKMPPNQQGNVVTLLNSIAQALRK
ncbi:MAG: hypothetical protein Kow00102_02690 [Spirochaetota bacterium]